METTVEIESSGLWYCELKVRIRIFVVSELQNSSPQIFECEEHNSDAYIRGNV